MRTIALCLLLALFVRAEDQKKVEAVSDDAAKEGLAEFKKTFKKTKDLEGRQNLVYDLHDLPHELVIKQLEKLLKTKDKNIGGVAALALGGQAHDPLRAGKILMNGYKAQFKEELIVISVMDGWTELKYLAYWPTVEKAMKDARNAIVIRVLDLLGDNKDWRAIPKLLEMFHVAMPKRVTWKTGEVKVDTGTAGDADQKAAEAKFNAKYGKGGSKAKAKAKRKAKAFDERNFSNELRKTVKSITGEDFDNAIDFEDWYLENYVAVHKNIAKMMGKDVAAAERKAKAALPAFKAKIEEERKKLEEELKKQREAKEKK